MIEADTPELRAVAEGGRLERVVTPTANDLVAVATAGFQFIEQGQWDRARNAFDAMIQVAPKIYLGYSGLGTVALHERNLQEAVEHLSKALELTNRDASVLARLGEAKLRLGLAKEAAALFHSADQLDPVRKNPVVNRARAMLAALEEQEAQTPVKSE
jgi:tetratricopeptide (TPR) repeat protein